MSHAALLLVAVFLTGCSCAVPLTLAGIGVGASVVLHDPAHAVGPMIDLVGCCQVKLGSSSQTP
jgi:hypothetical protein